MLEVLMSMTHFQSEIDTFVKPNIAAIIKRPLLTLNATVCYGETLQWRPRACRVSAVGGTVDRFNKI